MRLKRVGKAAFVTAVAVVGVITAAVPSSAAMAPAAFDLDIHLAAGGYAVASQCSLAAGYTTDPRFINFVVHASADAAGPSVPLATGVQCTVYDAANKAVLYGGASGSLVGPHAEAVGQATVPIGRIPAVCVTGSASYLDGTPVGPSKTCP